VRATDLASLAAMVVQSAHLHANVRWRVAASGLAESKVKEVRGDRHVVELGSSIFISDEDPAFGREL
jgi:hypothetical protein